MPQQFKKSTDLIRKMKKDLVNRTFPHLLTHLGTATKVQLEAGTKKVSARTPPIKLSVYKIPIPGGADVKMNFVATDNPTTGQVSIDDAEAYKKIFKRFYKDRLGSKALLLKLLASVGVT